MSKLKSSLLAIIFIQFAFSSVINVPVDQSTIQAGIDAASAGDTVLVAGGIYFENIDFGGKNVAVISADGATATSIDGNSNGSVVMIISGEGAGAVLDGFTITNGNGWPGSPLGSPRVGGGILVRNNSSPTLRNLVITGNTALGGGTNPPATGAIGGGIAIHNGSAPRLYNIDIHDNSGYMGGGLSVSHNSAPVVEDVRITGNNATNSGAGLFIGTFCRPIFCHLLLSDNTATYYGGGVWIHCGSEPVFNCTTISGNTAVQGKAVCVSDSTSPSFINSIIWGTAVNPEDIYSYSQVGFDASTLTFAYSDYQLGSSGITGSSYSVNWLDGNITSDPLFTSGDFTLQGTSPCINTGTASFSIGTEVIVDMTGDHYSGEYPDMGFFELVTLGTEPPASLPVGFVLYQNFPNPFNPSTNISYDLPKNGLVNITVYDILGNSVVTLVNENQAAGRQTISWNGRDEKGNSVSAGMYICRMNSGYFSKTQKMLLIK